MHDSKLIGEQNMKIEIELPEIEGYEFTGEYRDPKMNEYYLDGGEIEIAEDIYSKAKLILTKLDDPKLPEKNSLATLPSQNDGLLMRDIHIIIDYLKHLKDEINILKESK